MAIPLVEMTELSTVELLDLLKDIGSVDSKADDLVV
jgi:hypothetical protein